MRRVPASIFLLLFWTPLAPAAPLDRRQLPANVKWFIHLDADAGRASIVGKAVLLAVRTDPGASQLLAKFKENLNADPTRDIGGITVYGTDFVPEAGVLIVRGRLDRDKLMGLLHQARDLRTELRNNHEVYSWNDGTDELPRRTAGAFFDSDTFVFSSSQTAVETELDVLDGKSASLDPQSPLAEAAPAGSMVEAAALGLADARALQLNSPLLKQCDYGRFNAGEFEGVAFAHAVAGTRSPQVAENVKKLVAGIMALAQLSGEGSDAGKLLAPVKVNSDGDAVKVDWQMPAGQVAELLVGELRKVVSATRPAETEGKP